MERYAWILDGNRDPEQGIVLQVNEKDVGKTQYLPDLGKTGGGAGREHWDSLFSRAALPKPVHLSMPPPHENELDAGAAYGNRFRRLEHGAEGLHFPHRPRKKRR